MDLIFLFESITVHVRILIYIFSSMPQWQGLKPGAGRIPNWVQEPDQQSHSCCFPVNVLAGRQRNGPAPGIKPRHPEVGHTSLNHWAECHLSHLSFNAGSITQQV